MQEKIAVSRAVEQARHALSAWRSLSVRARAWHLNKLKNYIYTERENIVRQMVNDGGRLRFSAEGLLFETLNTFALDKEAELLLTETALQLPGLFNRTKQCLQRREPYGVVGIIAPSNSPFFESFQQIIQAVLMGNTVVVKPPECAPLIAHEIERLVGVSGIPDGVINIVHGGAEAGDALVRSPGVDKIVFFGTTAVGQKVIAASADTVKPLFLGLEGVEYAVVLKDCWQERAVDGLVYGAFCHSGQNCSCVRQVLIEETIADAFQKALVERTRNLKMKTMGDVDNEMGSLAKAEDARRLMAAVEEARSQGAVLLSGGDYDARHNRISPVILSNVTLGMKIVEQAFAGPYMCLHRIKGEEEAVRLANTSRYGLSASVWTRDLQKGKEIARRLDAGTVWVNETQFYHWDVPYGGIKMSGYGKSSGREGLLGFVVSKTISLESSAKKNFYWFPYSQEKLSLMRQMLVVKHDPVWHHRLKALLGIFIKRK